MKKFLIIINVLFISTFSFAQNDSTTIETYTSFLGYQYVQGESTILMPVEMLEIFQEHPAAFAKMKKARSNRLISQIFFSTGAITMGYAIVSGITQQNQVWQTASIGAGLVLAGIPFNRGFHKHTQSATAIFNEAITPQKVKAHLHFDVNSNGIGLSLRF